MEKITRFPLVVLAAGRGSRMRVTKGLLDFGGNPWILVLLKKFFEAGGEKAVVVLGKNSSDYFKKIPLLKSAENRWIKIGENQSGRQDCDVDRSLKIAVVINPEPEKGQFSSLQMALRFLEPEHFPGIFILPVDVPPGGVKVWTSLAEKLKGPTNACLPVYRNQGGHPVLISAGFSHHLLNLQVDHPQSRLDRQLQYLSSGQVQRIPTDDERVIQNFNHPEDWQNFVSRSAELVSFSTLENFEETSTLNFFKSETCLESFFFRNGSTAESS